MLSKHLEIFLLIQLIMVFFAYSEAVLEGEEGWAKDRKCWRFKISRHHDYTSYHIITYFVVFPLAIIILPQLLAGFSWSLAWLLFGSYLIGTILEDFMWFVLNPARPFSKWNPIDVPWYPWMKIGKISVPVAYVIKAAAGVAILIYLVK